MDYIIAHDFGTSSAKASLFTTDGILTATASVPFETMHEQPGFAVQDADAWWRAFCANNKSLMEKSEGGRVLGVSFSSAFPNCLLIDKEGKPLHRALIWQDTRGMEQAKRISRELPAKYTARAPGGIMSLDRVLVKLLWMKENQPEIYKNAAKLLPAAASYIMLRLTGKAVVDYAISYGTAMIERGGSEWNDEVLDIAGIDKSLLPELHKRTDVIGEVSPAMSAECGLPAGTKIICGTADSDCTCIGGGLLKPGDAFFLGGTSAEIDAIAPDGRKIGKPTSSSGASLSWLRDTIGIVEKNADEKRAYELIGKKIAEAPVGSSGVIFIPYLAGERGLRSDPYAKGSFTGINLATSRECLMRAVVEGIGFNLNMMLQDIRAKGVEVTRLPIVGGLGKGPEIRQIFADIMGVTLVTYEHMDEAAVAGAAVICGIGLGLYSDESAVKMFMRTADETVPIAENHRKYQEMMPLFEETYQALKTVYK